MEQNFENNKVTTIAQLVDYNRGQIVELPEFAEGQKFFARLRRPSLLGLVRTGAIPNSLLVKANELFLTHGEGFDPEEQDLLREMFDLLEVIAENTLVEPSYKEIKDNGIMLTDEQMMAIFNYTQRGVKALELFRTE